jgi:hypothetical protein
MRQLQAQDIFTFSRLLKKLDLKEQLLDLFKAKEKSADDVEKELDFATKLIKVAVIVLEDIYLVETEFYDFIVPISGKTLEEVKSLPLGELKQMVVSTFKDEGLLSFFSSATK